MKPIIFLSLDDSNAMQVYSSVKCW